MTNLYDDFEKRFSNSWFSAGWVEVEPKKIQPQKKDLSTLEAELQMIESTIEDIASKQLRLANLAKFYAK